MSTSRKKDRRGVCICLTLLVAGLLISVLPGTTAAKGLFVCSEHHSRQFDAWNVNADGTIAKKGTYGISFATDPAGVAVDILDPHAGTIIFITSEFSAGVEIVEVPEVGTPISHGRSSGPSNLAGIDVDDHDNIIYTLKRQSNDLYIYDWDTVAETLTQLAVIDLPGMSYGFGIAFDDARDILWVSDTPNNMVKAYDVDVAAWTDIAEIPSLSFSVSHNPVDVAVDGSRNVVYTVGGWYGSRLLSKYDVATATETTANLGHYGCGVAVDEANGYVYITGGPYEAQNISVWDCSATPFTEIQDVGDIGRPAGLAIASFPGRLNLAKNDVIVGEVYIGSTFTYEITCDNVLSPTLPAENVTILDDLPSELDFVSATHGGVYDSVAHTVFWDIGTIPAGAAGPTIELVVKVNNSATPSSIVQNYATINGTIGGVELPPTTVTDDEGSEDPGDEPGTPIGESIPVSVDIKPAGCPNPFNVKSNGVLPVAILGTEDFDVTQIDVVAILLGGVAPLRSSLEDVATPIAEDAEECQCTEEDPDGYLDLTLKFDSQAIVAALGEVSDGDVIVLTLEGALMECYGGVPIHGSDCIGIIKKGKKN